VFAGAGIIGPDELGAAATGGRLHPATASTPATAAPAISTCRAAAITRHETLPIRQIDDEPTGEIRDMRPSLPWECVCTGTKPVAVILTAQARVGRDYAVMWCEMKGPEVSSRRAGMARKALTHARVGG